MHVAGNGAEVTDNLTVLVLLSDLDSKLLDLKLFSHPKVAGAWDVRSILTEEDRLVVAEVIRTYTLAHNRHRLSDQGIKDITQKAKYFVFISVDINYQAALNPSTEVIAALTFEQMIGNGALAKDTRVVYGVSKVVPEVK